MSRSLDHALYLTGGYWVRCHCCGELHRAKEVCDEYVNQLNARLIRKEKEQIKHLTRRK